MAPDNLLPTRIEDLTRREFMASSLAAALLIACGGDDDEPGQEQGTTRIYVDRYGPVEIPASPQRLVALERVTLFHCLALGIQPIATTLTGTRTLEQVQPSWLDVKPRSDILVLDEDNIDLEVLSRLSPDMMVTYQEFKAIDSLRAMAPVVMPKYDGSPDWKSLFNGIADALNRKDEAAAFVKRYEDRVAKFRRETLPKMQGKTVSAVRLRPAGVRIEVLNSFPGQVFADAGVARPEVQQIETKLGYNEVSLERINEADADFLFVIVVDNQDENASLAQLQANPLWSSLKAVQNNNVHFVANPTWFGGLHYLAAERMLDELAEIVTA